MHIQIQVAGNQSTFQLLFYEYYEVQHTTYFLILLFMYYIVLKYAYSDISCWSLSTFGLLFYKCNEIWQTTNFTYCFSLNA